MNVFLLCKVRQAILDNPAGYCQDDWDCGTTACIAGWAGRICGQRISTGAYDLERVRRLLKLSPDQWKRLVHLEHWPKNLIDDYMSDGGLPRSLRGAQIAARRISLFMETDGAQ